MKIFLPSIDRKRLHYVSVTNSTEESLADAIIRLQRMALDERLQEKVEEAWELLNDGRHMEAEALVENVNAWIRQAEDSTEVAPTSSA